MTASIYDVASKAGVSISTVSRTFMRPELVSAKTLAKVRAAADELNYSITRAATTMKTGQSFRIALLVSDALSTWFNAHVLDGIDTVLHPAGYDTAVYRVTSIAERDEFFASLPIKKNADAVITASFGLDAKESERIASIGIPVIGLNPASSEGLTAAVGIDEHQAAALIARHLISLGHTHITYIRTNSQSSLSYSALQRYDAFEQACANANDAGEPVDLKVITLPDEAGRIDQCMAMILATKPLPTAIACQEDNIALQLLFRMRRYGLDVPQDISLIGFDDSTYAEDAELTTVHQDPFELGQIAARKALERVGGRAPQSEMAFETAPTRLVLRSSTAAPRA